jgi:GT2 family glycosyltransferase
MATYKRPQLLANTLVSIYSQELLAPVDEIVVVDDGHPDDETRRICERWEGIRYIPRTDRPNVAWSNPAIPINIGLRASTGDVIILQNPECKHATLTMACTLSRVPEQEAWFASVAALDSEGTFQQWYCHPKERPVPWFFCGAFRRSLLDRVGYFNESFTTYGGEDKEFAERMMKAGITFRWFGPEVLAFHQWHGYPEEMWK